MITSRGTHAQLNRAEREGARQNFGVSLDIIADKDFGPGGTATTTVLMRQQYREALEGSIPAIQIMLGLISANLKGRKSDRDHGEIIRGDPDDDRPREPENADLALLILGIAVMDDTELASLINADGELLSWRLWRKRPNRVEKWVADFALENSDLESDPMSKRGVAEAIVPEDRANVRLWDTHKDWIIATLMKTKGPGTTRFKPGRSGNYKGRPRKPEVLYPYDDFLMETVSVKIQGRKREVTRLDALMLQVTAMVLKNKRIARLVLKLTMRLHELEWNKVPEGPGEIIRG
jgi:hypothetical protein